MGILESTEPGTATRRRVFSNPLCAIDGHPGSYRAVSAAAEMAGEGGRVTVLAVTSFRRGGEHRSPRMGPLEVKGILDRAYEIGAAHRVEVRAEVDPASPPAQVILEWARNHDLLALGAPTTGWFEGMFTPSATVAALHSLPCPLLTTAGDTPEDAAPHILCATDGRPGSDELVALAAGIARDRDARLTLVHALHHGEEDAPERVADQVRMLEEERGLACELHVCEGQPASVVLDSARTLSPSLVVLGTRELEGLRTLGSQSRRVVHAASTPILLVPPGGAPAAR